RQESNQFYHSAAERAQPNHNDAQHRHVAAVLRTCCAKRHCPVFSAISASSAISALIITCTE
ncbi:MAG TPA: hypothetical protein VN866_03670, partial [Mycobacterium sp.]|nr:hypothetical protein [Mycobacterium sp.]